MFSTGNLRGDSPLLVALCLSPKNAFRDRLQREPNGFFLSCVTDAVGWSSLDMDLPFMEGAVQSISLANAKNIIARCVRMAWFVVTKYSDPCAKGA